MVMPVVFKLKNERVDVVIPHLFSCKEVEITSGKEVNHSEESNDKGKFRMAVKRVVDTIWVVSEGGQKALKNNGHSQISVKNGKTSPTYCGIWGQWSKTREARGKTQLQRKFEERPGSSRSGQRNGSSRKRG